MSNEVLIRAEGVSKKFCRNLKKSLIYGGSDIIKGFLGMERSEELRKDEFWAVSDVSFEVRRGECLGLIGHNGAGKSTLLKMLNGLIRPDKGRIEMHGKVGALIELGAGFSPLLTGRENVYNNGAVLGFTKEEIVQKFDEIVEFAELKDFIDSPVQNYSSGMKVRLGFAIAAQMEPDILIIDEVLAVGDLGFRVKCINRINELLPKTAIIFVSHAMAQVTVVCNKLILLNHGKIEFNGLEIGAGIEKYFLKFGNDNAQIIRTKEISIRNVQIFSENSAFENDVILINSGKTIKLVFELSVELTVKKMKFRIGIFNMEYRLLAEVDSLQHNLIIENTSNGGVKFSVEIMDLHLRYGKYYIHLHVSDADTNEKILRHSDVTSFIIRPTLPVGADFLLPSKWETFDGVQI